MNLKISDRQEPTRRRTASVPARSPRPAVAALHAAVIALSILLVSCSNSPYPEKDANANTLYSSMTEEPLSLDPAVTYGGASTILMNIIETPLQYNYVDRPYKLEPRLATEVPTLEYEQIEYDGNTARRPVYTVHIKQNVMYQNSPCFVEANRHLTEEDLRGIKSIKDFTKTATREMTADDFVYGVRRLCDQRIDFPVYSAFSDYLLGFDAYSQTLKDQLADGRKKRAAAAGPLYNQEMDEQFNPVPVDYSQGADKYPFIQKVDRYTFKVVLSKEYPQILYWMVFGFFSPIPHEAVEFFEQPGLMERDIGFNTNPVGTGPYMVETYDPTSQVVLVRNPNFHVERYPYLAKPDPNDTEAMANYNLMEENGILEDSGQKLPFIDRLVFRIEREAIPRWNKFMQGYYDGSGIQAESFDQTVSLSSQGEFSITDSMADRGIRLLKTATASLSYYKFNMDDSIFGGYDEKKQKLRQAISIAIDTGEAVDIFQNGMALEAQGPVPPGVFGNEPGEKGINPYVFNWDPVRKRPVRKSIEDAKTLLAEAGYPGGYDANGFPLTMNFITYRTRARDRSAMMLLTKQLQRINVRLETKTLSYNEFHKKMLNGGYQLAPQGWAADYPDPETFFILFHKSESVSEEAKNEPKYFNAEYEELYEKMSSMENCPERLELTRKMLAVLRKDAPAVFQTHGIAITLVHGWLHNYYPYPLTRGAEKYIRIDTEVRAAYRKKHNVPNYWPVAILLGALVAMATPAVLMTRRHLREK